MKNVHGLWCGALISVVALCVSDAPVVASTCPNAAVLSDLDRALPNCRAYEQVSPIVKNGNDVGLDDPALATSVVAADGSGVVYETLGVFPGAAAATVVNQNLSRRGSEGWDTRPLTPPQAPRPSSDFPDFLFFTPDLKQAVLRTPPGASLASGDVEGAGNLYLRDDHGTYTTLSVRPPVLADPAALTFEFAGASADLRHVLMAANVALTPDAPPPTPADPTNLYEWVGGQVRLVAILPDGTPAPQGGRAGGPSGLPSRDAISEDGSRIVFGTPVGTPPDDAQIYLRVDRQRTVEVSASQRATPDTSGPAAPAFWGMSADGSKVFFSSPLALTDDATVGVISLYRYDLDTNTLIDLSVDAPPAAAPGGGVQGVLGISRDGSQVYFQSTRQHVAGKGVPGQWNLYRWHDGSITFVAADEPGDPVIFESNHKTARITPDGQHLLFTALGSLTGYDNIDAVTGQPDREVFLYDAPSDRLSCISCNPSGARPRGGATLPEPPPRPQSNLQRGMTDDGNRAFFNTADALVPSDVNGKVDVYQYEGGGVRLLSTGSSSDDSYFAGASKTGDDVLIVTRERLVPTDLDDNIDMYDVRVGGGFGRVLSLRPCSGDGCQSAPSPAPTVLAPASSSVSGDGNALGVIRAPVSFRALAPSKDARHRAARTGSIALAVRVSQGGILKARASRKVDGRVRTVATATTYVPRAGTGQLRLRLAKTVRSALARGATVRLVIRVSFSRAAHAKTMTLDLHR